MRNALTGQAFLDASFPPEEQLPRIFDVSFREVLEGEVASVLISVNNKQIGDRITDNSYDNDGYRFHDVFHFSYAAILGWSPCVRKMLRRKRKSNSKVDEIEDGARAIIAEEAISLLTFGKARENNLFAHSTNVDPYLLNMISNIVAHLEVSQRDVVDWERAILKGYSAFRYLIQHKSGAFRVDMNSQDFFPLDN